MDQAHETIIEDEIPHENGKIKVTVDHKQVNDSVCIF